MGLYEELLQLVIEKTSTVLPLARRAGVLVTHAVTQRLKFISFLMNEWQWAPHSARTANPRGTTVSAAESLGKVAALIRGDFNIEVK